MAVTVKITVEVDGYERLLLGYGVEAILDTHNKVKLGAVVEAAYRRAVEMAEKTVDKFGFYEVANQVAQQGRFKTLHEPVSSLGPWPGEGT